MGTRTNDRARTLFDGIAPAYDVPAEIFSFGQYGRWRRFMVDRLAVRPGWSVLDVATGTGLVAADLRRRGARVLGLDLNEKMLAGAQRRGVAVAAGQAEHLPFASESFDALTFTYLMRYVDDPAGTLAELVRVLKPGAPMGSVEFGVPRGPLTGPLWNLYSSRVFPVASSLVSPGWAEAGDFLGPSITRFAEFMPVERMESFWRGAGMRDVHTRALSFGAGVTMWGRKR